MNVVSHKSSAGSIAGVMLLVGQGVAADQFDALPDPTRPFAPQSSQVATVRVVNTLATHLVLQAILVSPERKFATLNGKIQFVGDRLGDAEIVDIQPNKVIILRSGVQQVLQLLPDVPGIRKTGSKR